MKRSTCESIGKNWYDKNAEENNKAYEHFLSAKDKNLFGNLTVKRSITMKDYYLFTFKRKVREYFPDSEQFKTNFKDKYQPGCRGGFFANTEVELETVRSRAIVHPNCATAKALFALIEEEEAQAGLESPVIR